MALPIAAVVGATGTQGLSVTKALSAAGYHVRALTRSPGTATAFSSLANVEPFEFDIEKRTSVEKAFEGAEVVYAFSIPDDMWLLGFKEETTLMSEWEQGKLMANVAKEKGVKCFIWPTLEKVSSDKYEGLTLFNDKIKAEKYCEEIGLPAVFLQLGFFNDGITVYKRVEINDKDELVYTLPHAATNPAVPLYPQVSISHDVGPVAALLVKNFEKEHLKYKRIVMIEKLYSINEILEIFAKVTGKKTILNSLDSFGAPGSEYDKLLAYLADSSAPYQDSTKIPDATLTKLGYKLQTFEDYVKIYVKPYLGLK